MSESTEVFIPQHYIQDPKGKIYQIKKPTVFGRRDCEITISDKQMSSTHAEFIPKGIALFIHDLGSTNGTFVNGKQVGAELIPLKSGDSIQLGNTKLTYTTFRPSESGATVLEPLEEMSPGDQFKEIFNVSTVRWIGYIILVAFIFSVAMDYAFESSKLGQDLSYLTPLLERDIPYILFLVLTALTALVLLCFHAYISRRWIVDSHFKKWGQAFRVFLLVLMFPIGGIGLVLTTGLTYKHHHAVRKFVDSRAKINSTRAAKASPKEFGDYSQYSYRVDILISDKEMRKTHRHRIHQDLDLLAEITSDGVIKKRIEIVKKSIPEE